MLSMRDSVQLETAINKNNFLSLADTRCYLRFSLIALCQMNKSQFIFSLFGSLIMHVRAFSSVFLTPKILSRSTFRAGSAAALHLDVSGGNPESSGNSVTGAIYDAGAQKKDYPIVQLYTKEGCTLCDKVSDVLRSIREDHPHSLEAVDITDDDKKEIFDKYKWDIPVLHIDGKYWTKHKLDVDEATDALESAKNGEFEKRRGEPDAGEMERRMAERCAKE